MNKKTLITGVTGQDGSYLAEFLLEKGYQVIGMVRRTSSIERSKIDHLRSNPNFSMVYGDLCDSSSINSIIEKVSPDEIYNLAAQSHVKISFDIPEYTGDADGLGVVRILDAIKRYRDKTGKNIKLYQASTSELYGDVLQIPQDEKTPFNPKSPYAIAKLYAYWMCKNYRDSYDTYASNGILFNHESPRRSENFVTKKIVIEAIKIKKGLSKNFRLGNLDAKRDWGHAKDYIEAMWLILQQEKPDDYVIATGENHSVREFLEKVFNELDIQIKSNGKKGIDEEYLRCDTGDVILKIDPKYYRPAEVPELIGNFSKAKKDLGWSPKISFDSLIKEMVDAELKKYS